MTQLETLVVRVFKRCPECGYQVSAMTVASDLTSRLGFALDDHREWMHNDWHPHRPGIDPPISFKVEIP